MSEATTILGGTPIVKFEEAVEFLASRATNPCPCCGHAKWTVTESFNIGSEIGAWGVASINVANGHIYSNGMPFVLAACRKCAFIRMHGLTEISNWVAQGKPEFKDDE